MWLNIEKNKNEKSKKSENNIIYKNTNYIDINNQIKSEIYLPDWLVEKPKNQNER